MNRRDFLHSAGWVAGSLAFPGPERLLAANSEWRTFEVTTRVEVLQPSGTTRVWLPVPLTKNTPFQKTLANIVHCESGSAKTVVNKADALGIVVVEFPAGAKPIVEVTSRVATRDWSVDMAAPSSAPKSSAAELEYFRRATHLLPTDGIVKQTAVEITQGFPKDTDKARAIYDWIVDNTYRNPKTRGCGIGDIRFLLESKDLGGKCRSECTVRWAGAGCRPPRSRHVWHPPR